MRILIACEESQRVCIEMRKVGHEAYSCDILTCSGKHPEWHIQCDVLEIIGDGDKTIITQNKKGMPIYGNSYLKSSKDRGLLRSKTFIGIAKAMSEQWTMEAGDK